MIDISPNSFAVTLSADINAKLHLASYYFWGVYKSLAILFSSDEFKFPLETKCSICYN